MKVMIYYEVLFELMHSSGAFIDFFLTNVQQWCVKGLCELMHSSGAYRAFLN